MTPPKSRSHLPQVVRFDPRRIRKAMGEVEGFNSKLAVLITSGVGTMACAYLFTVIALLGLPQAVSDTTTKGFHPLPIVQWIAQTFLQLVLLSIIMVGQNVAARSADARAQKTYEDTERIIDSLDLHTEGGLKVIADRLDALERKSSASRG